MNYVIGVDVGTASARAGVFDEQGVLLGTAKSDIEIFFGDGGIVEQSSRGIWDAVCQATRAAIEQSGVRKENIVGIGFDATCSLAVVQADGSPLAVSSSGNPDRNVIVWMDHRAVGQAARINDLQHEVLKYVGGRISPEMQTPKLLWLKENMPETFAQAGHFFDFADYLTWRASGSLARSMCTLTCKWTYLGHEKRWDASYFQATGLEEFVEEEFCRIGTEVAEPGAPLANGVCKDSALELGLCPGTAVATGLIDAHAGGVGTVGGFAPAYSPENTMAYVFGTSSCTMTSTAQPVFVPGVWGPYYSAMVPGLWLNEGGQSAAGAAIDRLIALHPAFSEAKGHATAAGSSVPAWLAEQAQKQSADLSGTVMLAGRLHVVPEFLGNRAPFADPEARAVIAGLGMDNDINSLIALYVAGICSLGYGLRQILETQAAQGTETRAIVISGGAGRSPLIRQLLADATRTPILTTSCEEPVLLGSAILGAVAARQHNDVASAMTAMSDRGAVYYPAGDDILKLHEKRFTAYKHLQTTARDIAAL
ncbi:FGGY-family carbohydrate kinase [Roseibium sp.]|uniref:FGGY-family carbohydrate kinase n=1 Tax=Roseibium sp. TaxID=1936156 RepID=UPI003B52C2B1